jgi:hypothetical protein
VKKLHFDALKVELMHRDKDLTEAEVKNMNITQRKTKLKELEIKRLDNDEVDAVAKAAAQKAFEPLSEAQFLTD